MHVLSSSSKLLLSSILSLANTPFRPHTDLYLVKLQAAQLQYAPQYFLRDWKCVVVAAVVDPFFLFFFLFSCELQKLVLGQSRPAAEVAQIRPQIATVICLLVVIGYLYLWRRSSANAETAED